MATTVLDQRTSFGDNPRTMVAGLAWRRARGNERIGSAPDSDLLTALYEVSKRDAPDSVLPYRRGLDAAVRSRTAVGTFRPVPQTRREPPPAVQRLQLSDDQRMIAKVARLRKAAGARQITEFDRFQLLSQFDGHVLQVARRNFKGLVLLTDIAGCTHRREATFPMRLVRTADQDLLQPGVAFYYCVGRFLDGGRAVPTSILWFRRLVDSQGSPGEALDRGAEWSERIGWTN
jgi:hypothetical protein